MVNIVSNRSTNLCDYDERDYMFHMYFKIEVITVERFVKICLQLNTKYRNTDVI